MDLFVLMLVFVFVSSSLAGCAALGSESITKAEVLHSDESRQPAAPLDAAPVAELVQGNSAFALDLYHVLFSADENLFYSPYSLSVALAMTYAGARGETAQQMASALHYTLPQTELHPAFNTLDQALANPSEAELHVVNALWGQQGEKFLDAFLDTLARNYGAGLRVLDLHAKDARQHINQWVSEQTRQKIQDLLPPDALSGPVALVLTNAIYFKAAWEHPFAEQNTRDGVFVRLDGEQVNAPMMTQLAQFGYAERPGVQLVELPYAGGELSMVILLPDAGTFESLARKLDSSELTAVLGDLQPLGVRLTMPKFSYSSKLQAKPALLALGMVDAFGDADFSGMDGTRELFIDEIYHQAFISVDEAGSEAAAATAVVMQRKGGPFMEREVKVDRPFIFAIRDKQTGSILFLGQVIDPS